MWFQYIMDFTSVVLLVCTTECDQKLHNSSFPEMQVAKKK